MAFLHRIVLAFHLVCVEVGACGIRLVCLFLSLTGLDRFVAASYGAQQRVNRQIEEALAAYGQTETARLAPGMPPKDLTVTQDETFTGGLCLITMDPESNFILVEQLAQARDQVSWHAGMAPALAQLKCRVMQSTSDEAPGLLASVAYSLEAHHSPDLFHVQHELVKAVSGPMATKERAAYKTVTEAREQLAHVQTGPQSAGDEPETHRPSRAPKAAMSLAQAEQALAAASREYERLAQQRQQVKAHIRGLGHDDHFVDLERGVRRNGQLIASDIQGHIEHMRTIAQHEGLSQSCLERIEKAERVVPKMRATIEFVSGSVGRQVAQLDVTPPVSFAMHAKLLPAYYLDRAAETRTLSAGAPLRALAERLRAPLFAAGGALSELRPEAQLASRARPSGWPPCSSAQVPMWRGATATYPCVAINCEASIGPASGSAAPPFTTVSSPGLTAPRQRRAFSVRSRARWLRRFWTQWSCHLRLSVHLDEHEVADPLIEAH